MTIETTADILIRRRKIRVTFRPGDTVNYLHDLLKQVPMGATVDEVADIQGSDLRHYIEFHHEETQGDFSKAIVAGAD